MQSSREAALDIAKEPGSQEEVVEAAAIIALITVFFELIQKCKKEPEDLPEAAESLQERGLFCRKKAAQRAKIRRAIRKEYRAKTGSKPGKEKLRRMTSRALNKVATASARQVEAWYEEDEPNGG